MTETGTAVIDIGVMVTVVVMGQEQKRWQKQMQELVSVRMCRLR